MLKVSTKIKGGVTILIIVALFCLLGSSVLASVDDAIKGLNTTAAGAGFKTDKTDVKTIIADLIPQLLGFLGIIFMLLIIISGFQWMTAGGNTDKINKARQRIINASIGLAVVMLAYALTSFVLGQLINLGGVKK